jgi:hypothetical protein
LHSICLCMLRPARTISAATCRITFDTSNEDRRMSAIAIQRAQFVRRCGAVCRRSLCLLLRATRRLLRHGPPCGMLQTRHKSAQQFNRASGWSPGESADRAPGSAHCAGLACAPAVLGISGQTILHPRNTGCLLSNFTHWNLGVLSTPRSKTAQLRWQCVQSAGSCTEHDGQAPEAAQAHSAGLSTRGGEHNVVQHWLPQRMQCLS